MKPDNWGQMNAADKREMAMRLLNSQRGRLIVGKALAKAISVMQYDAYPEHSDMEDMEILGETLFELGYHLEQIEKSNFMSILSNYLTADDITLDKHMLLRHVADRIMSDLADQTRNDSPARAKPPNDPEHNG